MNASQGERGPVITVVFDNSPGDGDLAHGWGFAAIVRWKGYTLLFDAGNDGRSLLSNLRRLGVSLPDVAHVFLSHAHGDHAGGLMALLDVTTDLNVHLLRAFPPSLRLEAKFRAKTVAEVDGPTEFLPGFWSTGTLGGLIPEQALVLDAARGPVVLTGCAHPGIEAVVDRARELVDRGPLLLLGGLHLLDEPSDAVAAAGESLRRRGVEYLAPGHCTGPEAIETLRTVLGERFLNVRTGTTIDTAELET